MPSSRSHRISNCPFSSVRGWGTSPYADSPLQTIWKIQTDVENWPTWQPNVVSVVKDTPGRLRPGSVFR
ncbi:hypothetical protein ACFVW1_37755 [Streptomyces olivochromogenes]|uniref:hypothetical protein n=1 Tax=Streptomyces olivochromogenes TaxID=1963 RepID=UPI0036D9C910